MTEYQFVQMTLIRGMDSLIRILEKAELLAKEKGLSEKEILESRLAPDMFPFVSQVRIATDDARRNLFLLAGKEHVKMEDNESTFKELFDRVKKTQELLRSVDANDFDGAEERRISLFWMGGAYVFGKDFVQVYAVQNTFFHIVTAYDIIRHLGGAIGKSDYMGPLPMHNA